MSEAIDPYGDPIVEYQDKFLKPCPFCGGPVREAVGFPNGTFAGWKECPENQIFDMTDEQWNAPRFYERDIPRLKDWPEEKP